MDKLHFRPYSFRGRMIWALYIAAILSCVLSLVFAYCITHLNVQHELKVRQESFANYLLQMEMRTDLPLDDVFLVAQQEEISVHRVLHPESELEQQVIQELSHKPYHTVIRRLTEPPVTYVRLASDVVRIDVAKSANLFVISFFRVFASAISYLAIIVALITVVSFRITKPIQVLTKANERVQDGDFTVRLPGDIPGEMGGLLRSFNAMTESLGKTAYLQKDFISSVSHEFKTPIASIRGFARLLQMPGITEEQRSEYVRMIAQESDRLSRLSETLLRLTALEQQTAPANISNFSINEQIRQVILRLEPNWSSKAIDWQLELEDEAYIASDEALLEHVWINLIQNAIKFSPENSNITVRISTDAAVHVEITDHGCGMDAATIERIFDRFYQADRSRRQEGVGLGLCLTKRILDMLEGTITVTSTLGSGSTFVVTLPFKTLASSAKERTTANKGAHIHAAAQRRISENGE